MSGAGRRAVLFNPQVHVRPGDYDELLATTPAARRRVEEAAEIVGRPLLADLSSDEPDRVNAGPSIRPASVAMAIGLAESGGQRPEDAAFTAGISLGQLTAACFAGAMSFRDTVRMACAMPQIEDRHFPDTPLGTAFAYGVPEDFAESAEAAAPAGAVLTSCALTADNQVLFTTDAAGFDRLVELAFAAGGLAVRVPYSPPAHCALMGDVERAFGAEFVHEDPRRDPVVPLVCNITGRPLETADAVWDALVRQYTHRVDWVGGLRWMARAGVGSFDVVGPGHFVQKSLSFTSLPSDVAVTAGRR
ncbi:ACP S-malonyltransferase [Nocardioides pantholopis]|uniref:ACP S-malonyltransferase n=1 Tax=Nocardioides pantholopis TaxID=2483798 RepID=UPI000FDA7F2C|nr:ACP S-malonyltransferase [Nocardioides pantholopis]